MKPTTLLISLFVAIVAAAPAVSVEKRTDAIAVEARDISSTASQEEVKKREAEADPRCQISKMCY
ncbi:hypothetical protein B0T20DRAFT_478742 [Sordaria brevicollis]|uniref:Uncharacterized protein n=1 Tax=Sordaria brevicollis TaxID=83679 RepID=A0AAE0UCT7_SORBR|nr:hypothetical protein B0T20DRAFT_478742 [Sordaria brevicollis]